MARVEELLQPVRRIQAAIRDAVWKVCDRADTEELSAVAREAEGDTIYAVDRVGEEILIELFEREVTRSFPIILVAEGLGHGGSIVLPRGTSADDAIWRIIVDPIDGTRGAMYQKRSSWVLTGVAGNRGAATSLADIELAVQTEIPLVKQYLSDVVWAMAGRGARAERWNRLTGETRPLALRPSRATTIAHGFAMISRFFPGAREVLAAIDEEIVQGALGPARKGKAHCFEDQYICSGGQLYELMSGKDRFVADLRPLMERVLESRGAALGICCHPYDLCTELIAREAGVIVTDVNGRPLAAPLNVEENVSWVGYANEAVRLQMEPLLMKALRDRGLLHE